MKIQLAKEWGMLKTKKLLREYLTVYINCQMQKGSDFFLTKPGTPKTPNLRKNSSMMITTTTGSKTPSSNQTGLQLFFHKNSQNKKSQANDQKTRPSLFKVKAKVRDRFGVKSVQGHRTRNSFARMQTGEGCPEKKKKKVRFADDGYRLFLDELERLQSDFIQLCKQQHYQSAAEILIRLLNYTVDFNLKICFLHCLKKLAEFYFFCARYNEALFYYNQAKQCSILLSQPVFLIESLMGIAECCSRCLLYSEALIILKKALQYAWLHGWQEYQLRIYDNIGKQLYLMGQIEKAGRYHSRYIKAITEPDDSPIKALSKQRIIKAEQTYIDKTYSEINMLFLVHLSVPIKTTDEIPVLRENNENVLRNQFDISRKYFGQYRDIPYEVKKIMGTWFFREEIEEPPLPQDSWTKEVKLKKFAHVDFKLNQQLKMMGIKPKSEMITKQEGVKYKETLEQKIARKIKQLPLDQDWYEKIVKQIKRDHKNKLLKIRSVIRVRGQNKMSKPLLSHAKKIYTTLGDDLFA